MAAVLLQLAGALEGFGEHEHQRAAAGAPAIKSAGFDQLLDGRPTDDTMIDTLAEIKNVLKGTVRFARPDDFFGGAAAQAFDGHEAKENAAVGDREIHVVGVDV